MGVDVAATEKRRPNAIPGAGAGVGTDRSQLFLLDHLANGLAAGLAGASGGKFRAEMDAVRHLEPIQPFPGPVDQALSIQASFRAGSAV